MIRVTSPHGRSLPVGDGVTRLMGVVNVTPDSFFDGGRLGSVDAAVRHAEALAAAGAAVLDVGGESTRPGYRPVPADEQIRRVVPVIEALRPRVDLPISVDTTRAPVAAAALDAGADWINDTTALAEDPELAAVVARWACPIVLMHRFDPPRPPGAAAGGREVVALVADRLRTRVEAAVAAGIAAAHILLDPGIGFGTLMADNVAILAHTDLLRQVGHPLVIGPSRKSFLGHLTGRPAAERLCATAAAVAALALDGVDLVRVHDVAEMRDVALVAAAIRRERQS